MVGALATGGAAVVVVPADGLVVVVSEDGLVVVVSAEAVVAGVVEVVVGEAAAVVLKVPTVKKMPAAMALKADDRRNECRRRCRLARRSFAAEVAARAGAARWTNGRNSVSLRAATSELTGQPCGRCRRARSSSLECRSSVDRRRNGGYIAYSLPSYDALIRPWSLSPQGRKWTSIVRVSIAVPITDRHPARGVLQRR